MDKEYLLNRRNELVKEQARAAQQLQIINGALAENSTMIVHIDAKDKAADDEPMLAEFDKPEDDKPMNKGPESGEKAKAKKRTKKDA